MNAEQFAQIERLFQAAADLPQSRRAEFLDRECGPSEQIRSRVEALLEQFNRGESLECPRLGPDVSTEDVVLSEGPGSRIGPYKLLEHIGEGGFGAVFMADQEEPVHRRVALKIIKLGMDTRQVIARFEAERQALAMMEHPNIARVLDAGATETGRPYFVMELVRGDRVTEYCDRQRLTSYERLELFQQICHAVQHAHTKGIIHRDLKPSNVLVTVADGQPVPKVIDFGIAKATSGRLTDKTLFTEFRQLIGTPAYMSPEQADVVAVDIDTRSDIYALGVLLYELLTGTTPFDSARLRSVELDEVRRIIREEEPEKPSTRLNTLAHHVPGGNGGGLDGSGRGQGSSAQIAAEPRSGPIYGGSSAFDIAVHRRTDPASLTRLLRGDLDWIVMKCLEKDRTRRYETANGLAMDIQRHLDHEPVLAGPPGAAYRFRKFARRNRRALIAVGAIAASLVAGLTLATIGFVQAGRQREQAEMLALQRDEQRGHAEANFKKARDAVDQMLTRVAEDLANQPHMEHTRKELLEDALAFYEGFLDEHGDEPAVRSETGRAYRRIGQINQMLGHDPSFMFMRDTMVIREGSTEWSYGTTIVPQERHRIAEAAYASAISIQQQLHAESPSVPIRRQDLAESYAALGYLLWISGRPWEAEAPFRQAVAIGEELAAEFPEVHEYRDILGRSLNGVGLVTEDAGRGERAFRQALALYERLSADSPDQPEHLRFLAALYNNLALTLCDQARNEEEHAAFEHALELGEQLVARFPGNPDYRAFLALLLENFARHHKGQQQEQAILRALALRDELASDFPTFPGYRQTLTRNYFQLGLIHAKAGRMADALAAKTRAAEIQEALVADFPNEPSYRAQLGLAYRLLGGALLQWPSHYDEAAYDRQASSAELAEAEASFRQAVDVYARLNREFPDNPSYVEGLGISRTLLNRVLQRTGQAVDVAEGQRRSVDKLEALLAEDPSDDRLRAALGSAYRGLGKELEIAGDFAAAEEVERRAVDHYAKLIEEFPEDTGYIDGAVISHVLLSRALKKQGRLEEAEAEYVEALALRGGRVFGELMVLAKRSPDGVAVAIDRARSISVDDPDLVPAGYSLCATLLTLGGEPERAVALLDFAEQTGVNAGGRGFALLSAGRPDEAVEAFEQELPNRDAWSESPPATGSVDEWTVAYFLDRVTQEQLISRWESTFEGGFPLGCHAWFGVGWRAEVEGRIEDAIAAYDRAVELGKQGNGHCAANYAGYRLRILTGEDVAHDDD